MTVTVTPTVEDTNTPPRLRLDVTADAGETATTVTRLDPDGRTRTVRTTDGNPLPLSGGVGLVYDYEAPFGNPVWYSTLEDPDVSAEATVDVSDEVWLIHPGVPELSMPITVATFSPRARPVARGVFRVMGREYAVVQTDGARKAAEGALEVKTETLDELAALQTILSDSATLLLNMPVSLNWGVSTEYVSIGDVEESRLVDYAAEQRRYVSLPFIVVDRPEGGTQAERTYTDVLVDYASYADVMSGYSSYLDLLAGP